MYANTYAEARSALEKSETSCEALVSSYLDRIDERNGQLNAFVRVDADQALERAHRIDTECKRGSFRPLAGMIVGVKDVISRKDLPLTCASRILQGFTSLYSATAVEQLEEAGAILIGATNCDEFAMGSSNETSYYGPVQHPMFPDRVAGGSSGGSAAAVAADLCHTALGSDTGGSIRQPAAFCGVVGLKPTYGRVSRFGLAAHASSFDTIGTLTTSVGDAALVLDTISGRDPRDATSIDSGRIEFDMHVATSVRGLRVGIPAEYLAEGVDETIRHAVQEAGRALVARGAQLVELTLPHTKYGVAAYYVIVTAEASSNLARYDGIRYGRRAKEEMGAENSERLSVTDLYEMTRSQGFGDEVKRRIMLGTYVLSAGCYEAYFEKAARVRRLIKTEFDAAFGKVDVMLTPTTPTTAFKLGQKLHDSLQMFLSDVFTVTANLAGIPGLSVPYGKDADGLPIGIQLLGPPLSESTLLTIGHVLESEQMET